MGGKNEKYINTIEDYLEKPIKKGKTFKKKEKILMKYV